jgi:perosamine synthetase
MTDVQAGKQLSGRRSWFARRRLLAAHYARLLADIEELGLPVEPDWARCQIGRLLRALTNRVNQKAVMQSLLGKKVVTRRGLMCSHRETPYLSEKQRHDLRHSELVQDHSILLPIYAQMTQDHLVRVADALRRELNRDWGFPSGD